MRVQVLYFGVLKEIFSRENEMVEMAEGASVAGLLTMFRERGLGPANLWESLAVAVNQEYARGEDVLRDGDEVALLPPVSGGCSGTEQLQLQSRSWVCRRFGQNAGVLPVRLRSGQAASLRMTIIFAG
ncbi:MoaD/ThiS family protein [Edaphobacter bradus]|uniref:MoaD/ThiS family protein n=1 Tax=Edaphobacter bradus TaxID=2259016 RepID=UPI0021E0F81A|nr:MoaD/ThiS family protein [Edaphobacter bradus]